MTLEQPRLGLDPPNGSGGEKGSTVRVFIKVFYRKTLAYEMSKVPLTLMDDKLHASLCAMTCSFMGLKPKNNPKPTISLSEGFRTPGFY